MMRQISAKAPNAEGTSGSIASNATAAAIATRLTPSRRAPAEDAGRPEQQDQHEQREAHQLLERRLEEHRAQRLGDGDDQPADEGAEQAPHAADDHDVE